MKEIYFTQLDYMDLQAFLFHVLLAGVIMGICGYWSYDLEQTTLSDARKTILLEKQVANVSNNISFANEISKGNLGVDYKDSVSIVVVVSSELDKPKAQKELGEDLTIWVDEQGQLAKSCGVYSTPQAAIIDSTGSLFYRGNYNRSRYCTVRASNFAELSLIALLNNQPPPSFGLLSTQSYGCELSGNADFELF